MRKFFPVMIYFFVALSTYAQNAKTLPRTYSDTFLPKEFYSRKFTLPDSLKNKLFDNKNFSFEEVGKAAR